MHSREKTSSNMASVAFVAILPIDLVNINSPTIRFEHF